MDPSVDYVSWEGAPLDKEMDVTNPFLDYQGIVMANLDALYNLSSREGGALVYQTDGPYSYLFDGLSPGGAQYFLWRRPKGYAIWRVSAETNLSKLDSTTFLAVKDDYAPFIV